jgi:predicted PurR-regulated permease PerM
MRRAVGLNPVISITALLIGGSLGGIIGAILAIPIATALSVFAQDFLDKKKEREFALEE